MNDFCFILNLYLRADMIFGKARMQKKIQQQHFIEHSRQLALPFPYTPRFIYSEFISAPSNAGARAWLGINQRVRSVPDWPDQRLAIWGDSGTGKTHLLQIWAEKESALFLPGSILAQNSSVYWLEQIKEEWVKALVIDDADIITNSNALLHLLNLAKELNLSIILSGRSPPARWDVGLPDLASRLRAMTTVKIEQPEDELLRILFLRLLAERQLIVSSSMIEWLIIRLPRTAFAIRDAVNRLDKATLADGGGVTRNLAIRVLEDLLSFDFVESLKDTEETLFFSDLKF
ncbi:Chromosomal replication initiation ATPase DnaA (DnaA) (PDB:1L8Q) [Commensalibacter papalotli (ex Botero et al. 2024)]|uniref:Chromosomal replication initiator DnaA n=3 Tax=Acetobacteraceae TaxID=433 RepID=W7E1M8_9PROT|nr:Chromosomal replication initiator DnaA [Commensalibacter papalotli (ex Servin-Garciduenas et al. 2014)]CAI3924448.1 Chromosomal replication initiation ATPase DnaA (DnaA) (PDB:1L8Q) [Commensalibacter papalotli (ex Botero et al. 2024)]CAI3927605.1 Chromosomal replication initiation ATPase DnaA (DnaA) (PDB:1L8Q) [Commensalibacter papalotli (ex Botero et al. 2024)]